MFHGHDYSIYSESPSLRTGVYAWLAITAATISAVFRQAEPTLGRYLSWFHVRDSILDPIVVAATPLVIFSFLAWAFDIFLWKTGVGRFIFLIARAKQPPIIDGRYAGTSSWFDPIDDGAPQAKGTHNVDVCIRQTWERLGIAFSFPDVDEIVRSRSHSDMAFLEKSFDNETVRLQYTYSYEGVTVDAGNNSVRKRLIRGTCSLNFIKKKGLWTAAGQYYTDIGTSGEVKIAQCKNVN